MSAVRSLRQCAAKVGIEPIIRNAAPPTDGRKAQKYDADHRPPLSGLHHVGATVSDLDASIAWYPDRLGLEQLSTYGWPGVRAALYRSRRHPDRAVPERGGGADERRPTPARHEPQDRRDRTSSRWAFPISRRWWPTCEADRWRSSPRPARFPTATDRASHSSTPTRACLRSCSNRDER